MAKKTVAAKKRVVKVDAAGQLHVHSSFNNIIISLTNENGEVISWSSAGKMGFRGWFEEKHSLCRTNGSTRLCKNSVRFRFTQGESLCQGTW